MASFQAKIGWKRLRKQENKNHRSVPFLPDGLEKIPKKFKNTSTASCQAKIDWKGPKKTENKNFCSVSFLPDV